MYVGAALAVGLFDRLAPSAVAVLRLIGAAAVLLAWRRPPSAAWRGARLLAPLAFGLATGLMNLAFYEAIARLPLGTAVAIEFCGPVAVAAVASRRPRDVAAVVPRRGRCAAHRRCPLVSGPSRARRGRSRAAAMWAAYIVLGSRVATVGNGIDDMAVGFARSGGAALAGAPVRQPGRPGRARRPGGPGARAWVSACCPASCPTCSTRSSCAGSAQARFAVLLALLPATATVVGLVALAQVPGPAEAVGIAAVVGAVALRSRDGDPAADGRTTPTT